MHTYKKGAVSASILVWACIKVKFFVLLFVVLVRRGTVIFALCSLYYFSCDRSGDKPWLCLEMSNSVVLLTLKWESNLGSNLFEARRESNVRYYTWKSVHFFVSCSQTQRGFMCYKMKISLWDVQQVACSFSSVTSDGRSKFLIFFVVVLMPWFGAGTALTCVRHSKGNFIACL